MVSLLSLQVGQYRSSHRSSVKRETIALKVVHAGLFFVPLEQLGIKVFFQSVTHELPGNVRQFIA